MEKINETNKMKIIIFLTLNILLIVVHCQSDQIDRIFGKFNQTTMSRMITKMNDKLGIDVKQVKTKAMAYYLAEFLRLQLTRDCARQVQQFAWALGNKELWALRGENI